MYWGKGLDLTCGTPEARPLATVNGVEPSSPSVLETASPESSPSNCVCADSSRQDRGPEACRRHSTLEREENAGFFCVYWDLNLGPSP
jgi:hypothetical protein